MNFLPDSLPYDTSKLQRVKQSLALKSAARGRRSEGPAPAHQSAPPYSPLAQLTNDMSALVAESHETRQQHAEEDTDGELPLSLSLSCTPLNAPRPGIKLTPSRVLTKPELFGHSGSVSSSSWSMANNSTDSASDFEAISESEAHVLNEDEGPPLSARSLPQGQGLGAGARERSSSRGRSGLEPGTSAGRAQSSSPGWRLSNGEGDDEGSEDVSAVDEEELRGRRRTRDRVERERRTREHEKMQTQRGLEEALRSR